MHLEILDQMKGKPFLYHTRLHRILSYKMDKENCTIVTDKDWIILPTANLNKKLKDEFLPVEEENNLPALTRNAQQVQGLTSSLLESIQEIKEGKADYKKVNAINSTVSTMLSVFKTEAMLLRMKDK